MEDFRFGFPTEIRFALGCIEELDAKIDLFSCKRVFLVTDKYFLKSGTIDKISGRLKGKHLVVFDEVEENPSTGTIDIGAQRCRDHRCDLAVALGGGSILDAAKAISFLQKNKGSIETYIVSKPSMVSKELPVITIPTTSGTGSEVTPYSVLTYP